MDKLEKILKIMFKWATIAVWLAIFAVLVTALIKFIAL